MQSGSDRVEFAAFVLDVQCSAFRIDPVLGFSVEGGSLFCMQSGSNRFAWFSFFLLFILLSSLDLSDTLVYEP